LRYGLKWLYQSELIFAFLLIKTVFLILCSGRGVFMSVIQSQRAKLRRLELLDFEDLRLLEGDAEVVKSTPRRVSQTDEEILKTLKDQIAAQKFYEPFGIWVAYGRDKNDFIGWFMLKPKDEAIVELGYMVFRSQWGLGYATEICKNLLEFANDQNSKIEIVAKADADNAASGRVLEKLGFKVTDSGPLYDRYFDDFILTHFYKLKK
jgi:[ribosomal protein S5]-alanine N-acetyltransferase